jgi:tetratricopeptide (TPR) repeat protein
VWAAAGTAAPSGGAERDVLHALCDDGIAIAVSGRIMAAESLFTTLLSREPANGRAFNNLGNLYLWRGKPKLALEFYRAATEIDSTDAGIRLNTATALMLAGQERAALEEARKGVRLAGGIGGAADLLGLEYDHVALTSTGRHVSIKEATGQLVRASARSDGPALVYWKHR